jgi:HEAT repeat protein
VRRKKVIIVFALCVLVGIGVVAFWPGEREPEYNGKRLSEWLAIQNDRPEEASDAIRAIGTNALPVLVSWTEFHVPAWRYRLARPFSNFPGFIYRDSLVNFLVSGKAQVRSFNSVFAFRVLGTNASAVIPELSRFVMDARNRERQVAAHALAYIGGREALPPLLAALKDKTVPDLQRAGIAGAIPYLNYRGPELTNAVPVMIACLCESNQFVPSLAASALGTFLVQPEQCVPALTKAVESPDYRVRRNAIRALGNFGSVDTNAISAVSKALDDSHREIRKEATNALQKIAPEMLTNEAKTFLIFDF